MNNIPPQPRRPTIRHRINPPICDVCGVTHDILNCPVRQARFAVHLNTRDSSTSTVNPPPNPAPTINPSQLNLTLHIPTPPGNPVVPPQATPPAPPIAPPPPTVVYLAPNPPTLRVPEEEYCPVCPCDACKAAVATNAAPPPPIPTTPAVPVPPTVRTFRRPSFRNVQPIHTIHAELLSLQQTNSVQNLSLMKWSYTSFKGSRYITELRTANRPMFEDMHEHMKRN